MSCTTSKGLTSIFNFFNRPQRRYPTIREALVQAGLQAGLSATAPAREPANRADHVDDERLAFWDAEGARSSEATLSAPPATWVHARSTSIPTISP
jgi:hypothetical protein